MCYNQGMSDYVEEHKKFVKKFGTEEQCRKHLYYLRWPKGFRCSICGYDKARKQTEIQYRCLECRKLTYLYTGTIFENTRKPLTKWFAAIWYVTLDPNKTNASEMQRIVGLQSNNTALDWWHRLRQIMFSSEQYRVRGRISIEEFLQIVINSSTKSDEEISRKDFYGEE